MDLDDLFAVLLAVKSERKQIRELKVGEQFELPQRIHFRDDGDRCDLVLTVATRPPRDWSGNLRGVLRDRGPALAARDAAHL